MENYAERMFSDLTNEGIDKDSAITYLIHYIDHLKCKTVDLQLEKQNLEMRVEFLSDRIKDNISRINDLEVFIKKFDLNNKEE